MKSHSLTIREEHLLQLKHHLLRDDACERAVYLLCNQASIGYDPWDRCAHSKYLVAKVIPVPDAEILQSTPDRVTWGTASFVRLLKEAATHKQVLAIVHNHSGGMASFSSQDDENEPDLVQLAVNRNGPGTKLISMILTSDETLIGRVWLYPAYRAYESLGMIQVIGAQYRLHYAGRGGGASIPALHRQALAFGNALNGDLRKLRVGIVGCGGTGSAVAILLARLGVGQLVVIDNDIVDQTNLNRLHGARQADADAMRPKVEVVAREITEMGLGVRVVPIETWVGDPGCRDALRACDVLFGCTDDHDGRLFLNRFSYYYLIPVIDVGLAIEVDHGSPPSVKALDGRVTVLGPHHACLLCREVINPETARAESMRRDDPAEYERRKAESYVAGEGNPNPAVVTFTTELACMGVNELIHRLQGFRGSEGAAANRVRKFHLSEDRRPAHKPGPACGICAGDGIWGKGDTEPFLGRVG
ncbi:ThiF family adenylyltransferase [Nitrospira defluvii]|uniref:Thiamine biosynthesis protein ThiF n=1 Tax=Nitrospira defluvii TaxID=330214 RepID=A0ABN7M2G8_9BACT|nr:Thiamine biosynthesis protein ThiF [Nitrospira defluvii]